MKTIQFFKKSMLLSAMALAFTILSINQSMAQQAYDPTGTWSYTVPSPEGDLTGDMIISRAEDGTLEVTIKSSVYGTIELEDIVFEEMVLEGNADINGDSIEFEFKFDGDDLEGAVYTPDGTMEMTAERKKG
ncbi:MAG: hypothetical protein HWE07_15415 [Cytophagia bacterium]|nr:hypothetical protein [Cytophagia bacterium]